MRITDGIASLYALDANPASVVSVGVFDGVHQGHIEILEHNIARARELGAEATVVTFRGHPKALLLGRAPLTLTSLEHRLELFARAGIDHAVVLDFDEELRSMGADVFADKLLIDGLKAQAFVLGFDSKFGHDRLGTPEALANRGFEVEVIEAVQLGGRAISSTAIREAVSLGDLGGAARMLGRPVSLQGLVIHGDGRGKGLGFPTANLDLDHELTPPIGVWATRLYLIDEPELGSLDSVTNIGHRPTVHGQPDGDATPVVEVHVMDFDGDLYGKRVGIDFVAGLRGEQRFDSLDDLKAAIAADLINARAALAKQPENAAS